MSESNSQNKLHKDDDSKNFSRTDPKKEESTNHKNKNISILPNIQNKILKVIKETDYEGELNITDSMLLGIEDFYSIKNSVKDEGENDQGDLDLNGMDFSDVLKSHVKIRSPRFGNFQTENKNILSSAEKFLQDNAGCLNFNFSPDKLELRDEDIQMLFENLQSQKKVYDRSPIFFSLDDSYSVNNIKEITSKIQENKSPNNSFKIYQSDSVTCPAVFKDRGDMGMNSCLSFSCDDLNNCNSVYENIINNNTDLIGSSNSNIINNGNLCSNDRLFQSSFLTLLDSHLNFFNHFKEKIEEMESIKTRVNNLNSAFQTYSSEVVDHDGSCRCATSKKFGGQSIQENNNFPKKKEIKQLNNQIRITEDLNELVSSNFNTSSNKNRRENYSQKIDSKSMIRNNIISLVNSKNLSIEENSKSGIVKPLEIKQFVMNHLHDTINEFDNLHGCSTLNSFTNENETIFNHNLYDRSRNEEKKASLDSNSNNHPENINIEVNNKNCLNEKNSDRVLNFPPDLLAPRDMIDDQNLKSTAILEFSNDKINAMIETEISEDEKLNQILNIEKNTATLSPNKILNLDKSEIGDKESNLISESIINLKNVNDNDYDNMLNNLKINKLITGNSHNEFIHADILSTSLLEKHKETGHLDNKSALFTSDFICNNKPIKYKTNDRVLKFMSEMEEFAAEDLSEIPEEEVQVNKKGNYYNNIQIKIKEISDKINTKGLTKPSIGIKRNFLEHIKTSSDTCSNEVANLELNKHEKKFKTGNAFRIDKKEGSINKKFISNKTKDIFGDSKLELEEIKHSKINLELLKEKIQQFRDHAQQSIVSTISDKCHFLCICLDKITKMGIQEITQDILDGCHIDFCIICKGKKFISKENFSSSFLSYAITNFQIKNDNPMLDKQIETFLKYQFRFITWKFHVLSKLSENDSKFTILNIFNHTYNKYKLIFENGRTSFITKVAEKESQINKQVTLQIFDIKFSKDLADPNLDCAVIELTDGYTSVYSKITKSNPIYILIVKNRIYPGMKINIGVAKFEKISDSSEIVIQIFYNSISKADITSKLGLTKNKKFLIKNLSTLRGDGGEISQIDVIILKKYDYFVYDSNKNIKYSREKFEKITSQKYEETNKTQSVNENNLSSENEKITENISGEQISTNLISRYDSEINDVTNIQGDLNQDTNCLNNTENKSNEGIFYVFELIVVDSLLWYDHLNSLGRNSKNISYPFDEIHEPEVIIKKNLRKRLLRQTVIKFKTTNLDSFKNLNKGGRYQLSNLNKDTIESHSNPIRKKLAKLKADESILIKGIKFAYPENDSIYISYLYDMSSSTNTPLQDPDICEGIYYNFLSYEHLLNKQFSFDGIYLNRNVLKNRMCKGIKHTKEGSAKYIFFVTKENNLVMIELHDENFFDTSKFTDSDSLSNPFQIFSFRNMYFQMLYFFKNFTTKILSPFDGLDTYNPHFAKKFIVIFMKTCDYTSFKIDDDDAFNYLALKNKIYESKSEKKPIYEQTLLDDIIESF